MSQTPQPSPIERLFEQRRAPLTEIAALREMLSAAVVLCEERLRRLTSLDLACDLARVDQGLLCEHLARRPEAVLVSYDLPAWSAAVDISLSPRLLFATVDAMFGGDGSATAPAVPRQLTEIERKVATLTAETFLVGFQAALGKVMEITTCGATIAWESAAATAQQRDLPVLAVVLKTLPMAEEVVVTLPVALVEDARGRLQALAGEQAPANDPGWRQAFQQSVMSSEVELVASAPGPSMTLGHVARLDVGFIIELEPDSLRLVELSRDDSPIFEGRLGQSKGLFTVMLEQLAKPRRPPGDP